MFFFFFFFSSRRRHTRWNCDWSSDVCSSDLRFWGKPMDEPRDDIDTWLEERVTPLLPRPGTFDQIRKRARRRKLGQAAMAAGAAAVVVAAAIVVPQLVLSRHVGGAPAAVSGSTTP